MSEITTESPTPVGEGLFDNKERLLEYYGIQAEDFRMRHMAIWTEVKHYTWVLSIILGAGPVAIFGESGIEPSELGLLLILPVFGFFVAFIAFFIIRSDFVYYTLADSRLLYLEKMLGVTNEQSYRDSRLARAIPDTYSVAEDANIQSKIGFSSLLKLRIRALILSTFVLYAIAAIFEITYFAWLYSCTP